MYVDHTLLNAAGLAYALTVAPEHLSFPLLAIRDAGCRYVMVGHEPGGFHVAAGRPAAFIVGDDTN